MTRSSGRSRSNTTKHAASDLADETCINSHKVKSVYVPDELVGEPPKSLPSAKVLSTDRSMKRRPISPFTMNPTFTKGGREPSASQHGPTRVEDEETHGSDAALAGNLIVQTNDGIAERHKASDPCKSALNFAMSTLKSSENRADPQERILDPRTSPIRTEGFGASNSSRKDMTVPVGAVHPDEINDKVMAMLAATDALKPKDPGQKTSSATKMSRKVLTKVSSA